MKNRHTTIIAASILLMAGAAASAQTANDRPRTAIQNAAQLTSADITLVDAIGIAEKQTGGVAIAIRLTTDINEFRDEPGADRWRSEGRDQTSTDAERTNSRTAADARRTAERTDSDGERTNTRTNPDEDRTSNRTTREGWGETGASDTRAQQRPMFAVVTCVVDRSKIRDVYVDLAKKSVVLVRTPHAQDSAGLYDQTRGDTDSAQSRRTFVRASDLMNSAVRNTRGEKLGDIDELAINPETNHVVYGVLRRGGFLGMGESRYAISTSEFHNAADRHITLRIDESDFDDQSGFKNNDWPLHANAKWSSGADSQRSTTQDAQRSRAEDSQRSRTEDAQRSRAEDRTEARTPTAKRIVKASDIIGSELRCSGDEEVGTISDLVVEPSTGRIAYAIVETDRGEIAVPIESIRSKGDDYSVMKTSEQMRLMPTIRRDRDPDWGDESWNRGMKQSYGSPEKSETISSEPRGG